MKILLSFHYYRDTDLDELCAKFREKPLVFADSGAFSAKSIGAEVKLADYMAWLHRWSHIIDTYVSLDVIGDPEATRANHEAMEAEGLSPIPVFHGGSPWEYLDAYCERYPYVALGNMVSTAGKSGVKRWLLAAFKRGRATGTVFHGFGQTSFEILRLFPFYSVDSSSWAAGQRYGTITLWDRDRRRWVRAKVGTREILEHARLIRAHGGDPTEMVKPGFAQTSVFGMDEGRRQRAMIVTVNLTAWLKFEAWLREHHGPVELPGQPSGPHVHLAAGWSSSVPTEPGPHVFLAGGGGGDIKNENGESIPQLAIAEPGPHVFLADTSYEARDLVKDRLPPLAMPTGPIVYLATAFALHQLLDGLGPLGLAAPGI